MLTDLYFRTAEIDKLKIVRLHLKADAVSTKKLQVEF